MPFFYTGGLQTELSATYRRNVSGRTAANNDYIEFLSHK
jgi:hypothetical protein